VSAIINEVKEEWWDGTTLKDRSCGQPHNTSITPATTCTSHNTSTIPIITSFFFFFSFKQCNLVHLLLEWGENKSIYDFG